MPLLNPQIQKALNAAASGNGRSEEDSIKDQLNQAGLSVSDVLDKLADILNGGENEPTRLRAAELAMKAHGMLKDNKEGPVAPVVNIFIKGNESNQINPILIPR